MKLSVELTILGKKTSEAELGKEAEKKLLSIGHPKISKCLIYNRPAHELQYSKVTADVDIRALPGVDPLGFVGLHWCGSANADLLQIQTRQAYGTAATVSVMETNLIKAKFEHDSDILTIMWLCLDHTKPKDYGYKLGVSYDSISNIVVDHAENRIFLYLRYPPKVFLALNRGDPEKCFHWKRILDFDNCPKDLISTAPCLFLDLKTGDHLYEILSRLKLRTRLLPSFGCLDLAFVEQASNLRLPTFENFAATYLCQAFLSRGLPVTIPLKFEWREFCHLVQAYYRVNDGKLINAFVSLLNLVDERRSVVSWCQALTYFYGTAQAQNVYEYACVTIRKIIVTPSRLIMLPPEILMGNRVLRKFGEEHALRVCFRDDDMGKMGFPQGQGSGKAFGHELMENRVKEVLSGGLNIGNRNYEFLAYSNSQLRDHGCYAFASYFNINTEQTVTIDEIRKWMGDFSTFNSVPKLMAREGQTLTQTQNCLKLTEDDFVIVPDIICAGYPPFSDGIGTIPYKMAHEICKKHTPIIPVVPSAYQIRIAGMKGMLSVQAPGNAERRIKFRESMVKFKSKELELEIVKYSSPCAVYLNRPLIMILDQVTQLRQDKYKNEHYEQTHARMSDRIHSLVEKDIFSLIGMLYDEEQAVSALQSQTSSRINFGQLRDAGFTLTKEPLFRSMLLAVYETALKQRLSKQKIEIPMQLGRTMYGILDEYNVLKYGEVFVKYSTGRAGSKTTVVEGDVMVTKNPNIVLGDVRILNAVNNKQLRHLVDVIVFPQQGPRPHTDEIAGSDLDGDEFAVIWDEELMFDENMNHVAMERPKDTNPETLKNITNKDRVNFFIKHMKSDSIGKISLAHLAQADRYGITSDVCNSLAVKHYKQVDFPKTGVLPDAQTSEETPKQYPGYMEKCRFPSYRSTRLNGQIHRKFDVLNDIFNLIKLDLDLGVDRDLIVEFGTRDDKYKKILGICNNYSNKLRALIQHYGIANEGSLISGNLTKVRNRISDREKEDFSFLNTEKIVQSLYNGIYVQFRKEFFKEFGGEDRFHKIDADKKILDPDKVNRKMLLKAKTWYTVSYNGCTTDDSGLMRSLPWVVWDVLCLAKKNYTDLRGIENIPKISAKITESLDKVVMKRRRWNNSDLEQYRTCYPELQILMQMLREWIHIETTDENRMPRTIDVCLLFVNFGIKARYFDKIGRNIESRKSLGDKRSELLMEFFRYLSSRDFKTMPEVDLNQAGIRRRMDVTGDEWDNCRLAALGTLCRISLTLDLSFVSNKNESDDEQNWSFAEMKTMMIEVAKSPDVMENLKMFLRDTEVELKIKSGVTDVRLRDLWSHQKNPGIRVLVSATGTTAERRNLKRILLTKYSLP